MKTVGDFRLSTILTKELPLRRLVLATPRGLMRKYLKYKVVINKLVFSGTFSTSTI